MKPTVTEPILQRFYSGLRTPLSLARKVREQANKFLAEDFSCFDYVDLYETKLSQITADLLRPEGTHGQGDLFLRSFLDTMKVIGRVPNLRPRISVEEPTQFIARTRRIDITLLWDDFILAIENKPWAEDQDDQLSDYVRNLDRRSKSRFLLIYLSGSGSGPDTTSITSELLSSLKASGQMMVTSFPRLMSAWLEHCIEQCQAEKVRWFLRDFRSYLLRAFPEENERGRAVSFADDLIVEYALQNDDNLGHKNKPKRCASGKCKSSKWNRGVATPMAVLKFHAGVKVV